MSRSDWLMMIAMAVAVTVISILISIPFASGEGFANLNQPAFAPPAWVFPIAWSILYLLIGAAGWFALVENPYGRSFKVWLVQLVLNWIWTPVFFGFGQLWLAVVIIVALAFSILYFIALTWRDNRVASVAMMPYLAWVSFAAVLNIAFAALNG